MLYSCKEDAVKRILNKERVNSLGLGGSIM